MRDPEAAALLAFCVTFWWVIDGPGSPSWRAGFGLAKTDNPARPWTLAPRRGQRMKVT